MKKFRTFSRKYLSIPYGIFMMVFIIFPLIILFLYAICEVSYDGSLSFHLTLNNFKAIFNSTNVSMLEKSLIVGLGTTALCLLLGYPAALILNNPKFKHSNVIVMLFMMPMWINFLLRTLATQAVFQALSVSMGMGTVIFGMVYNYLPYMIMPIYNTIQKIDKSLFEGAQDLGASPRKVLLKVTIPLSLPGILSGITMVFMPTITTFAISSLLSGNKIGLIGDYIYSQSLINFNVASAMSFVILLIIGISMIVVNKYDKDNASGGNGLC